MTLVRSLAVLELTALILQPLSAGVTGGCHHACHTSFKVLLFLMSTGNHLPQDFSLHAFLSVF